MNRSCQYNPISIFEEHLSRGCSDSFPLIAFERIGKTNGTYCRAQRFDYSGDRRNDLPNRRLLPMRWREVPPTRAATQSCGLPLQTVPEAVHERVQHHRTGQRQRGGV